MDGWIRIGTKIENKQFDKQISRLKGQLKTLEASYDKALNPPKGFKTNEKNLRNLEIQIEQTRNKIIDLENAGQPKSGKNGFDKLYSSAKKLAFGILSIRTAYTLLSRASSAYLATDTETTQKMQANWSGLGTILAPAIKFLVDLMRKAVIGVLHFMSVLTGIDFVAKANANAIKSQTDATKELAKANQKATASFDEMNVLQDASTSGINTDDIGNSLFDINELSQGTRDAITKVAEALKPVYEMIKNIVGYCLDNPDVILGMLGGVALLTMLAKVIGYAGAGGAIGTGLAGIWGILLAIASIGVIVVTIKTIYDNGKKADKEREGANAIQKSARENFKQMTKELEKLSKQENKTTKETKRLSSAFKNNAEASLLAIQRYDEMRDSVDGFKQLNSQARKEFDALGDAMATSTDETYEMLIAWGKMYENGELNQQQITEYKKLLNDFNVVLDNGTKGQNNLADAYENSSTKAYEYNQIQRDMAQALLETYGITKNDLLPSFENFGDATNNTRDKLRLFIKEVNKLDNKKIELDLTMATDKAKKTLTDFFTKFQTTIKTTFSAVGLKLPEFPTIKLAHGGIINNPGRGVSLGNGIIGGEAGREMVMPLDSQTMAQLGQEIGKWITINANIINQMNGRTISRELQKINADSDFAFNK